MKRFILLFAVMMFAVCAQAQTPATSVEQAKTAEALTKAKESIREYCEITPYASKLCDTYGFKPTQETLKKYHNLCDYWDLSKNPMPKACENLLPFPPPKKP